MADDNQRYDIYGYPNDDDWSVHAEPIVLKDHRLGKTPMLAVDLRDDGTGEPWINLAIIDGATHKSLTEDGITLNTMWQSLSVDEIDDLITALKYAKGVLTREFKE